MRATQLWHAIIACGTAAFLSGVASADNLQTAPPSNLEYGAHPRPDGWVDFGLRAPAADTAELLIYDAPEAKKPASAVPMTRALPATGVSACAAPASVPAPFTCTV